MAENQPSTPQDGLPTSLLDPTNRPPVPAGLDLDETRQPETIAITIIIWLVAVLSVLLRLVSRRIKGARLWLDDWVIVAAVPFSTTLTLTVAAYGVSKGLGRHLWATPSDSLYAWAIVMLIGQVTYSVVVVCFKWSILALYWRLFRFQKSVRILVWLLVMVVFLWGLAVMLVPILQCHPVYALWARFDPVRPMPPDSYNCRLSQMTFLKWNAIPTLITDLAILVLPMPYVWGLQLPQAKKIGIVATFCLGSFVLVVSIVRLSFLVHAHFAGPDVTWNYTGVVLWSIAEANVGILCACLPLLLPVITKLKCVTAVTESRSRTKGSKGFTGTAGEVGEEGGMAYPLEQMTWHGQSLAEVRASRRGDKGFKGNLYTHYRGDDESERSLRRPDEESAEVPSWEERHGSGPNRILITTEISVEK